MDPYVGGRGLELSKTSQNRLNNGLFQPRKLSATTNPVHVFALYYSIVILSLLDLGQFGGMKLVEGQAIELEDGTMAYVQNTPKCKPIMICFSFAA